MKYDPEKCSSCAKKDLCKEGTVDCIVSEEVEITTDLDTGPVIVKTRE